MRILSEFLSNMSNVDKIQTTNLWCLCCVTLLDISFFNDAVHLSVMRVKLKIHLGFFNLSCDPFCFSFCR